MAFQKFMPTGGRGSRAPMVSVRPNGSVGFNRGIFNQYNLAKLGGVILFHDPDSNQVGFQFTKKPDDPGAHRLNFSQDKTTAQVSAAGFFNHVGHRPNVTTRYRAEENKDGMLVIDLDNPLSTSRRRRKSRAGDEA